MCNFHELPQTLPNRTILDSSQTFHQAALALREFGPGSGFFQPASVLFAHSIELFLKALFNPEIPNTEGRDVPVMETRKPPVRHQTAELLKELKRANETHLSALVEKRPSLGKDLEELDGLFQAARYSFEANNIDSVTADRCQLAQDVSGFLQSVCHELEPIIYDPPQE